MSDEEWCREEVLRARRGDGVGEVLPLGRRAEVWSLIFVGVALLLFLCLSLPTPDATFFAGRVTRPKVAASEGCTVALAERCALAASTLLPERQIEIRERSAFGTWRQATVRSVPACIDGGLVALKLEPGSQEIPPGTAVLMRVAKRHRPIHARLGELRPAQSRPSQEVE